jgi:hypothetical protein
MPVMQMWETRGANTRTHAVSIHSLIYPLGHTVQTANEDGSAVSSYVQACSRTAQQVGLLPLSFVMARSYLASSSSTGNSTK